MSWALNTLECRPLRWIVNRRHGNRSVTEPDLIIDTFYELSEALSV
jgi:hypothetical protein